MLCQQCKKNNANTTITRNINGKVTVRHLCAECAAKEGVTGFEGLFSNMLGGLFSDFAPLPASKKCRLCGTGFEQFASDGKAGCPVCYTEFYDELLPSLQKLHGRTGHIGKRPRNLIAKSDQPAEQTQAPAQPTPEQRAEQLQKELDAAVAEQKYEQAAALRDKIKAIREGKGNE